MWHGLCRGWGDHSNWLEPNLVSGPFLGGGERAWYTLYVHTRNIQRMSSIIHWIPSLPYGCILNTQSLYFTLNTLWRLWIWCFERLMYDGLLLSLHFKQTFLLTKTHLLLITPCSLYHTKCSEHNKFPSYSFFYCFQNQICSILIARFVIRSVHSKESR